MEQFFITKLTIRNVRHLKDISIPLSEEKIKHLILTGKNGSGKTSVVDALAEYLNNVFTDPYFEISEKLLHDARRQRDRAVQNGEDEEEIRKLERDICEREDNFEKWKKGLKYNSAVRRKVFLNWQRNTIIY